MQKFQRDVLRLMVEEDGIEEVLEVLEAYLSDLSVLSFDKGNAWASEIQMETSKAIREAIRKHRATVVSVRSAKRSQERAMAAKRGGE